eukprot:jgi/Bigna1/87279/estExt_fgenesh1_pg.C_180154
MVCTRNNFASESNTAEYALLANCVNAPKSLILQKEHPEIFVKGTARRSLQQGHSVSRFQFRRSISKGLPTEMAEHSLYTSSDESSTGSASPPRSPSLPPASSRSSGKRGRRNHGYGRPTTSRTKYHRQRNERFSASKGKQVVSKKGQVVIRGQTTRQSQFSLSVHVSHIPAQAGWGDLAECFQRIGPTARIYQKPDTTWAHVHFYDPGHVEEAMRASAAGLLRVCGQRIKVSRRKKGRHNTGVLSSKGQRNGVLDSTRVNEATADCYDSQERSQSGCRPKSASPVSIVSAPTPPSPLSLPLSSTPPRVPQLSLSSSSSSSSASSSSSVRPFAAFTPSTTWAPILKTLGGSHQSDSGLLLSSSKTQEFVWADRIRGSSTPFRDNSPSSRPIPSSSSLVPDDKKWGASDKVSKVSSMSALSSSFSRTVPVALRFD